MFGHQDDQNHHHHDDDQKPMDDVLSEPAVDSVLSTEHHGSTEVSDDFNPALPTQNDNPFSMSSDTDATTPTDDSTEDTSAPVVADEPVVAPAAPTETLVAPSSAISNDLLSLKQQALTELSPLVGHLDQTPEEKFRTTMMLIQASDNQDLVKTAYEAAQAIADEKIKAQALLDIVNEINYFTQQHAA